ncbi:vanin-like protein 3 [Drosophila rhopaloa]|uniref:Vanin-like protein 3 n=1 Tax=Drosophila rhopaloa TaxID=1041015 RepID=A0A6P4ENX1_DRORH|nr:vanin-like protein 3 [Drosophila rhopaloa]XP_016976708.1 vanin-like protein 3 [Drosophila rhopaloa]
MFGLLCRFLWLLSVAVSPVVVANTDDGLLGFYTAGVAEFRPAIMGGTSQQLLEENLLGYLELMASGNGTTDIIVFPEATLNSVVTLTAVPESTAQSLCDEQPDDDPEIQTFLRRLACAAREYNTYLVINVKERAPENCPSGITCSNRGYIVYNTNVVFNRQGAVVSRYRKWNLYLEPSTNRTEFPELATFKTDFNVTFGHFICFDMLFYTPAQDLVERLGIRHVIVTKMFNSELPFLTASQLQQGWAWGNRVNLLASGASIPLAGVSGSGIYAGEHGALARLMITEETEGQRKLLLAQVPLDPEENMLLDETLEPETATTTKLKLLQQPELEKFATWELPMVKGSSVNKRICQQDLCCEFQINWTLEESEESPSGYYYRLGVWVGERRYEEEQYSAIRLCGLFSCSSSNVQSCGLINEEQGNRVIFTKLQILGEFVRKPRRLITPSTLSFSNLYALQPSQLIWSTEETDNLTRIKMELRQPHSQLMTFAIYGNYFDEYANGGATTVEASRLGTLLFLLITPLMMMHLIWE